MSVADTASMEPKHLSLETRPESLAQVVFDAIRDAIVNKTLPPGSRVTETSLAEQLSVSKTPVREALLKLRDMGLIELDGRRGGRIVRPSRASIQQAYEVREALEVYASRAAAERAGDAQREQIAEAARRCLTAAEAGDVEGFRVWDGVFHERVSEAVGNPRLAGLIDATFALVLTLRRRDVPHRDFPLKCARAHVRIADAISKRDPELAERAMRAHVQQVEGFVLANFADEAESEATASTLEGAR